MTGLSEIPDAEGHFNRRYDKLDYDQPLHDEQMLSTVELGDWLSIGAQTLESWRTIDRQKGLTPDDPRCKGPPYLKINSNLVRYNVGRVRDWLARQHQREMAKYRKQSVSALGEEQKADANRENKGAEVAVL